MKNLILSIALFFAISSSVCVNAITTQQRNLAIQEEQEALITQCKTADDCPDGYLCGPPLGPTDTSKQYCTWKPCTSDTQCDEGFYCSTTRGLAGCRSVFTAPTE